jgi:phosphocarrier protein HPr
MKEVIVKINNASGLHARPAAVLVNCAKNFTSNITIRKNNKEINLKSLLSLLSLGVCQNEEVVLKAIGEDEDKAIEELTNVIGNLKD